MATTNKSEEQLSALMDGEVSARELDALLTQMHRDPELRQRLSRYSLISDAIHKRLPRHAKHDLHARVKSALEREPVMMLPSRRVKPLSPWMRQAAGFAIAASATAVAILGFQAIHFPENSPWETASSEQAVVTNSDLDPYVLNHNEHAVSAGMHGMLPYVRMVSYGWSE